MIEVSFEEYARWARSQYPEHLTEVPLEAMEMAVYAPTEPPVATEEECPVTVRSYRGNVVITPVPKRSR